MMLDEKRLAEIKKLRTDASFGYATCSNREYARDVKELLDERDELLRQIKELLTEDDG